MIRPIMRVPVTVALIAALTAPVFAGEVYFNDFNAAPGTTYLEWTSTGYTNSANRAGTVTAGSGPEAVASTVSPNGKGTLPWRIRRPGHSPWAAIRSATFRALR